MLRIHCKIALCFLISLFDLSAILKIRNGEHAHYVGLVVAYARTLGTEKNKCSSHRGKSLICYNGHHAIGDKSQSPCETQKRNN